MAYVNLAGVKGQDGAVATPTYGFQASNDTGMYNAGSDTLAFASNGVNTLSITSTIFSSLIKQANVVGTAALPAYTFTGDLDTGMYHPAANQVGLTTNGVVRLSVTDSDLVITTPISVAIGSATDPAYTFTGFLDTGMYSAAGETVDFTTNGTLRLSVTDTDIVSAFPISNAVGSASDPTYTFTGDLVTGMYHPAANQVGFATNSTLRLNVTDTDVVSTIPLSIPIGSASDPTYTFTGFLDTGMYSAAGETVDFTTNGVVRLSVTDTDIVSAFPISNALGSASDPTYTFTGDLVTGMYHPAGNQVGFATNSTLRLNVTDTDIVSTVPISNAGGTAGDPAYTFTGDLDTGMYSATGNDLEFSVGGTRALLLDSTGATLASGAVIDTDGSSLTLQANGGVGVLLTGDPIAALGVATKQYADSVATGLDVKASCRVATTASLAATFSANVITADANGAISIDSVSLSLNDRVLVKDDLDTPITAADQVVTCVCVAKAAYTDNTGSTQDYFDIFSALNANEYRVHFDFTGTNANIPSANGLTLLRADISGDTTATDVGDTLVTLLNTTGFDLPINTTGSVVVTNSANGSAEDPNGATAESAAGMTFTVDTQGVTLGAANGIYTVTVVGDGSTDYELTRATDADTDAEVAAGMFTFITEGTINADIGYVLTTNDPIEVNFSAQTFTQFSSQGGDVSGPGATTATNQLVRWTDGTGTAIKDTDDVIMTDAGLITFSEGTTATKGIVYPDALADAFHFTDGSNQHLTFDTTNDNVLLNQGKLQFANATTGENDILIVDNLAASLTITESSNAYMTFVTTNTSEQVQVNQDVAFSEGVVYDITQLSANTTLSSTHYMVEVTTGAGDLTMTLPALASSEGRVFRIVNIGGGDNVIVDPNGAEEIDGSSTSVTLSATHERISLVGGTTSWYTI